MSRIITLKPILKHFELDCKSEILSFSDFLPSHQRECYGLFVFPITWAGNVTRLLQSNNILLHECTFPKRFPSSYDVHTLSPQMCNSIIDVSKIFTWR